MKTAILTDSTAIIDPQIKKQFAIKTIPLPLLVNGKRYYEKYDYDRQQLRQSLQAKHAFLMVGQVAVETLQATLDDLNEKGYTDVICIYLDNSISGLGSNLQSCAHQQKNINLHLLDTHSIGIVEGQLAILAAQLIAQDRSVEEIWPILCDVRDSYQTVLILKNMKHIATTGYVKNGIFPGEKNLLHSKTLMQFNKNGQLGVLNTYLQDPKLYHRIRRMIAPAYQVMAGQLQISITRVPTKKNNQFIMHLLHGIKRTFPVAQITVHEMPLSMIAHLGMDGIVISWD